MSLIADALKRAQEQRKTGQGEDRARRMLTGPGPLRVESRDGPVLTRPLALAAAAVIVGAVVLAAAIVTTPTTEEPVGSGLAALRADGPADAGARGRLIVGADRESGGEGASRPGQAPRAGVSEARTGAGVRGAESGSGTSGAGTPDEGVRGADVHRAGVIGAGAFRGRDSGPEARPYGEDGGVGSSRRVEGAVAAGAGSRAVAAGKEESSFRITVSGGERQRTAEQYFRAGLAAQRVGELERAAALYRSALELRPADAELWNNLGTVYRGLAMPEEAMAAFRSAVEADASYAPAWSNLGLVLDAAGRDGEAIDAFREALRRDPGNAGAKVNLANKYQALGMREEARSLLREVLREDPSLPEAHYGLARVLEEEGDTMDAERHYRLFLELGRGRFPALEVRVAEHLAGLAGGER